MPTQPALIVDLHTHLFNARCLPLAGIFANAMNVDAGESPIAIGLAKLVNLLTESSSRLDEALIAALDANDYYIEKLSDLAAEELTAPLRQNLVDDGTAVPYSLQQQVIQSDIYACLSELEVALVKEGDLPEPKLPLMGLEAFDPRSWAKRVVSAALQALQKSVTIGDEIDNYAAFIFNMLAAEEHMAETLIERYGTGLPRMQFVHHMMDMQMAYVNNENHTPEELVAPKYPFYHKISSNQLSRMRDLASLHKSTLLGFAAFDPRRPNWREIVDAAIAMGFTGFKFYTAMGYLPIGNEKYDVEARVLDFFRLCIQKDIPVFTHCTPVGFQTRLRQGLNADPRHWEQLLQANNGEFSNLRLCFGHAGGGKAENNGYHSPGWLASDAEWKSDDNYAYTVARLCSTYPNLYCEFAYITDLIDGAYAVQEGAHARFVANLQRVLQEDHDGLYHFGNKMAYGSDWNMPSMVTHPRAYLDVFLNMFDKNSLLSPYREKFFWDNAYTYLKLH